MLAPKGSLEIHEEAWNAYPYCKTVLTVRSFSTFLISKYAAKLERKDLGHVFFVRSCALATD